MASVLEHNTVPQIHKDGPSSLTDLDHDQPVSTIESPQDDLTSSAKQYLAPIRTRPTTIRRSTEPSHTELLHQAFNTARPTSSHRNRSPFSRSHLRSRSTGAALSVPITRSASNPVVNTALRVPEFSGSATPTPTSASPLRSSARQQSPLRQEEPFTTRSPRWLDASNSIGSIREDSEADLAPRSQPQGLTANMPMYPVVSRSSAPRRRPHSPLHSATSATSPVLPPTILEQSAPVPAAGADSPSEAWLRYNEACPPLHHSASSSSFSSMPSTPTSARSRSPSISSLETIEDAPDLESEAIELERLERLKLAAERAERAEAGGAEEPEERSRRGSFDAPRSSGFGFSSRAVNRERKRWSVCGAERRADLDLETIYED